MVARFWFWFGTKGRTYHDNSRVYPADNLVHPGVRVRPPHYDYPLQCSFLNPSLQPTFFFPPQQFPLSHSADVFFDSFPTAFQF